jgi:hypothetical protein
MKRNGADHAYGDPRQAVSADLAEQRFRYLIAAVF